MCVLVKATCSSIQFVLIATMTVTLPQVEIKYIFDVFRLVSRLFPDFDFGWIADETRRNLPLELDFLHEVDNCEKATENLKRFDWVKVCTNHRIVFFNFLSQTPCSEICYVITVNMRCPTTLVH